MVGDVSSRRAAFVDVGYLRASVAHATITQPLHFGVREC